MESSEKSISERGQEIYDLKLRTIVETEENIGKIISIDVESGDYDERFGEISHQRSHRLYFKVRWG